MHLLESLQQQNAKIVIPTPALAEVLVRAAKGGPEFLRILSSSKHFRIAPFDERAAVEFAARQAERIAAVESATTIYSDDEDIAKLAEGRLGVIKIAEIPLPPETAQRKLPFETNDQGSSKP
jgi:hypothetical protein